MAFKAGLEKWDLATKAFLNKKYSEALFIFDKMHYNSKVHFNIGVIHFAMKDYPRAIDSFTKCLNLDNYSSIAYFQRAVSYMHTLDYELAFEDFNDSLLYLRGNSFIDYTQLGLEFRLHASEILYNRALCLFLLGSEAEGMNDLHAALKEKDLPIIPQINIAMDKRGRDCPIFSMPEECLYKPSENMLKNSKKVDYLGQAKVIASNTTSNLMRKKSTKTFPENKTPTEEKNNEITYYPTRNNTTINNNSNISQRIQVMRSLSFDPASKASSRRSSKQTQNGPPKSLGSLNNSTNSRNSAEKANSAHYKNTNNDNGFTSSNNAYSNNNNHNQQNMVSMDRKLSNIETSYSSSLHTPVLNNNNINNNGLYFDRNPSYTNFNEKSHHIISARESKASDSAPLPQQQILATGSESVADTSTTSSINNSNNKGRNNSIIPINKMKIKCHYDDIRTILVDRDITYENLIQKIRAKYQIQSKLILKYKDEDEELVLMTDQEDLNMALSLQCTNTSQMEQSHLDPTSGFDGRLEVWCFTK